VTAIQRPFSGEPDLQAMAALVYCHPCDNLPYRPSSWPLDDPKNVGMWVDAEGQLWMVL